MAICSIPNLHASSYLPLRPKSTRMNQAAKRGELRDYEEILD
jgi:hypothetical protein